MTDTSAAGERSTEHARCLYEEKILAELSAADGLLSEADRASSSGDLFAEIMLVKGQAGPAEEAGGPVLSGPDGEAASRALEALGFDPASSFATLSRPRIESDASRVAERLRLQLEAVDPSVIIALDQSAAQDVIRAADLPMLKPGAPVARRGRVYLAVNGLERSLADPNLKRRIWCQLQTLRPRGSVW